MPPNTCKWKQLPWDAKHCTINNSFQCKLRHCSTSTPFVLLWANYIMPVEKKDFAPGNGELPPYVTLTHKCTETKLNSHTWTHIFSSIGRERPWGCGGGSLDFRSFFCKKNMTSKDRMVSRENATQRGNFMKHVSTIVFKSIIRPWQQNICSQVEAPAEVYSSYFHSQFPAANLSPNLGRIKHIT